MPAVVNDRTNSIDLPAFYEWSWPDHPEGMSDADARMRVPRHLSETGAARTTLSHEDLAHAYGSLLEDGGARIQQPRTRGDNLPRETYGSLLGVEQQMAMEIAENANRSTMPGVYATAPLGQMREPGPVEERWGAMDWRKLAAWAPSAEKRDEAVQVIRHDEAALSSLPYASDIASCVGMDLDDSGQAWRSAIMAGRLLASEADALDAAIRAGAGQDARGRRPGGARLLDSRGQERRSHRAGADRGGHQPAHGRQPPVRACARHAGRRLRRAAERGRARDGRAGREHRRQPRHQRLRPRLGAARARAPAPPASSCSATPSGSRRYASTSRRSNACSTRRGRDARSSARPSARRARSRATSSARTGRSTPSAAPSSRTCASARRRSSTTMRRSCRTRPNGRAAPTTNPSANPSARAPCVEQNRHSGQRRAASMCARRQAGPRSPDRLQRAADPQTAPGTRPVRSPSSPPAESTTRTTP